MAHSPLDEYADIAALHDVAPHSFRRTVPAEIDEVYDADAAKDQLGHKSRSLTDRQDINRRLAVSDYRATTERPPPRTELTDDPAKSL